MTRPRFLCFIPEYFAILLAMATANIKFGPSGWRAVIADKFTLSSLRRIAHAAAEHLRENREYGYKSEEYLLHLKNSGRTAAKLPHVVVGYDTRYFSAEFGRNAAEAFAAEGLTVLLSNMETPTPAASWTVMKTFAAGGFMMSAGSEPAHYSGISWIPYWGGPALPEVTDDLELRAQGLTIAESEKIIPYDHAVSSGVIKIVDFRESYLGQIYSLLDAGAVKKAGLRVAADSLHGTAGAYLRTALEKLGVKVVPLRENRDILFGGVSPEQIEKIKPLLGTANYKAGDCPQIEGQPSDKIYFILSGEVEIIKQGLVIARLKEGETFGEMELLDIMPSIATVRAATPLEVVTISNRALYEISKLDLKTFSMMIMNLARDLSRRLRRMDELACLDKAKA